MDLHGWADLATVILVVQAFVACLVFGVIYYFVARGLTYVLRELPKQFAVGRRYLYQAQAATNRVSEKLAAPFTAIGARAAQVRGVWAGVRKIFTV